MVLPKGFYKLLNEGGIELKTSTVYYHPVQSHPNTNTSAEMPFKFGADKEDEDTSPELTKSVKVNLLEKDHNTILSNGCLGDNVINESQTF